MEPLVLNSHLSIKLLGLVDCLSFQWSSQDYSEVNIKGNPYALVLLYEGSKFEKRYKNKWIGIQFGLLGHGMTTDWRMQIQDTKR